MRNTSHEPAADRIDSVREGEVTRIEYQKKNPRRVSVYIEDAFAFGIFSDLLVQFGIQNGAFLGSEKVQRILHAERLLKAKAAALNLLSYRARTERELRDRLVQKGFHSGEISEVTADLREAGYIDDHQFAKDYIQGRISGNGIGPYRARQELMGRGVDPEIIETIVGEQFTDSVAEEMALLQARRRWPRLQKEPDELKRKKKLCDYLLRRGFDYEIIRRVVDQVQREAG